VPGGEPGDRARDRGEAVRSARHRAAAGGHRADADSGRGREPRRARAPGRIAERHPTRERAVIDRGTEALDAALAALRRKERATAELADWLRQRGYGEAEVDAAIARLAEAGELDDERFARAYAEDKRALRGWGAERIRAGLAARGIAEPLIEAVLEGESEAEQVAR